MRTRTLGVEVVSRYERDMHQKHPVERWYISLSIDNLPWRTFGPFDEKMTLLDALPYTKTMLDLEANPQTRELLEPR